MHSAKASKDIRHNLLELAGPASSIPGHYADQVRTAMQEFLADVYALHEQIYAGVRDDTISQSQVSSLLNVIRELLTSNQSLIYSLGDYYLDVSQADSLERVPV